MLFEACLSGKLHHVPRRPHDRERSSLIKSGSVFIYEENASGIKRWTDGVAWSPSRILGNFLIYRELEKPFPPGEKKRAMKRKRSDQIDGDGAMGRRDSEDNEASEVHMPPTPPSPKLPPPPPPPPPQPELPLEPGQESEREFERQLIGSLVDSYGFRSDGLVKKTMSVSINGVSHHLVSYYKLDDVKNRLLIRPLNDPRLAQITVRPELYLKQNFRSPVEETEHYIVDPSNMHAHPGVAAYGPMMGGYGMRPGQYMPQGYPMYSMQASSAGMYASTPAPAWPGAHTPGMAPTYAAQSYGHPSYGAYYDRASAATPQSAPLKVEDQAAAQPSYGHFTNPTPFQGRQASGSFSSYQSPMRPSSSAGYGASSQPQHGSPVAAGSTTHQQHQYNGTPTQAHSFDSKLSSQYSGHQHTGSYGGQQANPMSAAGSNQRMKSPAVTGGSIPPITGTTAHLPYRPNTGYGTEMDGSSASALSGYSSAAAAQPSSYAAGSYGGYATAPQGYRSSTGNNPSIPGTGHY